MQIVEASPLYLSLLFVENDDRAVRGGLWTRHHNGVPPFEPQGFAVGATLPAEVRHGQWIVRCDGCANAQFTRRDSARFFCVDCLNQARGAQWVAVAWPADVEKGEAVLLARPLFQQRNWLPGQTLADLMSENRQHGDPIPEGVE